MEGWAYLQYRINPVFVSIGPVSIHWYGIMYLIAFFLTYYLVKYRIKAEKLNYSKDLIYDFMTQAILGAVLGGRLGYVLFYNLGYFMQHPLEIVSPFDLSDGIRFVGIYGMSYHGGLLGVAAVFALFCKKRKLDLFRFVDLIVPAFPLGYMFGRIGNFINGELFGRATDVAWGMYFKSDMLDQLRHPSQLYEAFFEGLLLFAVLWYLRTRSKFEGFLFSVYLICYGVVRFFIEYYREPDAHLGFIVGSFSMGQLLCLVMIAAGIIVLSLKNKKSVNCK